MSQENVTKYSRITEAFSRRDLVAFPGPFDPDVDFFPRSAGVLVITTFKAKPDRRRPPVDGIRLRDRVWLTVEF